MALLYCPDCRLAYTARFPGTVVDKITLLEVAGLPVGRHEIAQCAAAFLYGRRERFTNGSHQSFISDKTDTVRWRTWVDSCLEEAFRCIDIAHPNDNVSGQQHLLDGSASPACHPVQQIGTERRFQRLYAQPAQQKMLIDQSLVACMPEDGAEAARIGHAHDLLTDLQVEMVMFFGRRAARQYPQMARHAKVHDKRPVIEPDQEIFSAPSRRADALTAQEFGEAFWERPSKATMTQRDARNHLPFQMRGDASARYFDFG